MAIAGICTLANVAIRNAVTVYYFKYVIGVGDAPVFSLNLGLFPLNFDIITVFMTTGSIAFLIGCAFSGRIGKLLGKRNALITLTLINAVAVMSFYLIPPESVKLIFCVNIFASLVAGPTPAIVWALYTDVADYNEWKFNRRSTGLIFSATMFAQKFGYTIGASAAASMLALFGYVANQAQTPEALGGILMMYSIIPGGLALINGIILFFFPLTQEQTNTIQAELEIRRAEN
jgi:GPH family glycoside/pentoside/hexuronide:cation symporter